MTPEQARVVNRSDATANPAVARLRTVLSSGKDAEEGFRNWRSDGYTRLFASALQELADSPPFTGKAESDINQILIQTGMTMGLSMALKLITQPKRLFPEIFGGSAPGPASASDLTASYTDDLDSVIDYM